VVVGQAVPGRDGLAGADFAGGVVGDGEGRVRLGVSIVRFVPFAFHAFNTLPEQRNRALLEFGHRAKRFVTLRDEARPYDHPWLIAVDTADPIGRDLHIDVLEEPCGVPEGVPYVVHDEDSDAFVAAQDCVHVVMTPCGKPDILRLIVSGARNIRRALGEVDFARKQLQRQGPPNGLDPGMMTLRSSTAPVVLFHT